MGRSKWKGNYINIFTLIKKNYNNSFIVSRNSKITPKLLNTIVYIYNGRNFAEIKITENMIGHKFGEFSFTRKNFAYNKKIKKK
jgi:small subunit ribosomal protein S19